MTYGKYDYFNIGIDSPEISIKELAEIYTQNGSNIFGYSGKIILGNSEDKQYLVNNPLRRCPNIDKARSLLGYRPSITVSEGVGRFMKFIKEDPSWRES